MSFAVMLRRMLLALVAGVALMVVGGPWALYGWGLSRVDGRPQAPAALAEGALQAKVWRHNGGDGAPEMVSINPVAYVMSAAGQSTPPASTALAWRVASAYSRDHLPRDGGKLAWNLSSSALTIWITRNWSIEQLLTAVAAMDAQTAVGGEASSLPSAAH